LNLCQVISISVMERSLAKAARLAGEHYWEIGEEGRM
jgi:hypothetical protein